MVQLIGSAASSKKYPKLVSNQFYEYRASNSDMDADAALLSRVRRATDDTQCPDGYHLFDLTLTRRFKEQILTSASSCRYRANSFVGVRGPRGSPALD